jgi:Mce-associated membrane protein
MEPSELQAISATRGHPPAMAAFNCQDMDANRAGITAGCTPEFAHRYDQMVKALRDIVVTSKGVTTATADHVAVERLDDASATVIGFVDQRVTAAPQGNSQKYRMVVTLLRSGGHWSVNNVATV